MVVTDQGEVKAGIVCARCALRAVAFVIPPKVTVPTACELCKRGLACVCRPCAEALAQNVRELTKANVALALKPPPL